MRLRARVQKLEKEIQIADVTMLLQNGDRVKIPSTSLIPLLGRMMTEVNASCALGENRNTIHARGFAQLPILRTVVNCQSSDEDGMLIQLIQALFMSPHAR